MCTTGNRRYACKHVQWSIDPCRRAPKAKKDHNTGLKAQRVCDYPDVDRKGLPKSRDICFKCKKKVKKVDKSERADKPQMTEEDVANEASTHRQDSEDGRSNDEARSIINDWQSRVHDSDGDSELTPAESVSQISQHSRTRSQHESDYQVKDRSEYHGRSNLGTGLSKIGSDVFKDGSTMTRTSRSRRDRHADGRFRNHESDRLFNSDSHRQSKSRSGTSTSQSVSRRSSRLGTDSVRELSPRNTERRGSLRDFMTLAVRSKPRSRLDDSTSVTSTSSGTTRYPTPSLSGYFNRSITSTGTSLSSRSIESGSSSQHTGSSSSSNTTETDPHRRELSFNLKESKPRKH